MINCKLANNFVNGASSGKGSNMYIEQNVIYSYGSHFPIAVRLEKNVYLFNKDGYSHTTAKHKSYVLRAINSVDGEIYEATTKELNNHIYEPDKPIIIVREKEHENINRCMDNIKTILLKKGIKRAPIKKWTDTIRDWAVARCL